MRIRCIKGWEGNGSIIMKGEEFQQCEGSDAAYGVVEFIGVTEGSWNYNHVFDFMGDLLVEHFEVA